MKEGNPKTDTEQEAKAFIRENYPLKREYMRRLFYDLKSYAEVFPRKEIAERELKSIQEVVGKTGILTNRGHALSEDIPMRLATLKKFEDEGKASERQLNTSEYVRLLAIGELIAAKRGDNLGLFGKNYKMDHVDKAVKLMRFYKKLSK